MERNITLEAVKKDIRSLLLSSQMGLSIQKLLDDHRTMLGRHLPFKELGYNSAIEMVKHMPDVVVPVFHAGGVMHLKAVADSSTKHIQRLVEQQKKTGKINRIRKTPDEALRRPPRQPLIPFGIRVKLIELMKLYQQGLPADQFGIAFVRRFGIELRYKSLGFSTLTKLLESCSDIVEIVERVVGKSRRILLFPKTTNTLKNINNYVDPKSKPTNQVFSEPSKHAQSSKFQVKDKVIDKNGLVNSERKLSDRRTSSQQQKKPAGLMDLDGDEDLSSSPSFEEDPVIKVTSGVSEELKKNLTSLFSEKPNGVWMARLPFEYKKKFSKDLDVEGAGYLSLVEMIGSLPDLITMQRPVKNGDWLLTGQGRVASIIREDPNPRDSVTAHGIFKKVSHPMNGQIQIFIVHIVDPWSFCFHYCDVKSEHDKMMDNIRSFYTSTASQKYLLPPSLLKPGQVCCAVYDEDEEWYRAEIIKVISNTEAEVFYVDYGNSATVPTSNLRLLKKDFIELPAMGIRGTLANVLPKGTLDWSVEAGKRFFELTNNRTLMGIICGHDKGAVQLHLIDTNVKQQVHVNDVLVIEGFAIYANPISNPTLNRNPTSTSSNNAIQQSFQSLNPNTFKQLLASYDPAVTNVLLPYLFQQLQQGQQPSFTQADIARTLSTLLAGFNQTPQPQITNPASLSPAQQQPSNADIKSSPSNTQQSDVTAADQASLASFIEAVNSEVEAKPRTEGSAEDNSDVFETDSNDSLACYVNIRRLLIPEAYNVHAINIEGKPYVSSGEIAALFWHGDILRAMLRKEKASVRKVVISREEYEELFNELIKHEVGGVCDANGVKDYMTVYELESLPTILQTFKHKSDELIEMVALEVSQYKCNPENYWITERGEGDEGSDEIEDDSQSLELELEELRLLLQSMQFRRKRLVNSLINKKSSPIVIDEIKQVEEEIERVRRKVQSKEGISK
eukprot:gene15661-17241_t